MFTFHDTKWNPIPVSLMELLLYVELFEVSSSLDDATKMYQLQCKVYLGPNGQSHHNGVVIPITAVMHAVELIPVYGCWHNHKATTTVSLETYDEFYLNNYFDKSGTSVKKNCCHSSCSMQHWSVANIVICHHHVITMLTHSGHLTMWATILLRSCL